MCVCGKAVGWHAGALFSPQSVPEEQDLKGCWGGNDTYMTNYHAGDFICFACTELKAEEVRVKSAK